MKQSPANVDNPACNSPPPDPRVDWNAWIADYSRIRDAIERPSPTSSTATTRIWTPGGFPRPLGARKRA